ncbi:MAG: protein kinase [Pirellulales bacterium]
MSRHLTAPLRPDFDASLAPSALDALSREQQERLTEILDRYLRDLDNGLPPRPEHLLEAHPDLAEVLRTYLDNLTRLHEVAAAFGQPGLTEPAIELSDESVSAEANGRRLGDFMLLAEVGRGGMGVVYEARQISLDRRVALKVLPFAAVLEAQQITRFKNEAQAAAQLHHPNIVPVFAIGAERGVHYYAMQFIDGQPLDRIVASLSAQAQRRREARAAGRRDTPAGASTVRLPAAPATSFLSGMWPARREYFHAIARLGIQAAGALAAAHNDGIVHRDIKPSNLLLDGNGKLWVTDFGLARCQSDRTLTRSGDVVGTRQYMSPEQALGKGALVDQRTDIYALGVTLYELLTLEPAFGEETLAGRRHHEHLEPRRPRLIDPSIPLDLETVVLKAMAYERDDRYTTADELADDLRRVLAEQPTVARPPTFWDRAGKFARRHRRAVTVAATVCLLFTLGTSTAALLINRERASAQRNFERAERNFREARSAVDQLGARLADRLTEVPGARQVRRELLADTLDYYQRFVHEAGDDPALRADLALTYSKIGTLNDQLGSAEEAIAAHRQALALCEQAQAEDPHDYQHGLRAAVCRNNLALALRRGHRTTEARQEFQQAIALQEQLLAAHADDAQCRRDLGRSHNNLGLLESEAGRDDAARAAFERAIQLQEADVAAADDPSSWRDLAASYNNLAALVGGQQPQQSVALHRKAADYEARAAEARPHDPGARATWALTLNNLGAAQARNKDLNGAVASYRRAIELEKELLRQAPLETAYRRDLAVSYNNLGLAYTRLNEADKAVASFHNALGFQRQLLAEAPHDLEIASALGGMHNNLGIVLEDREQVQAAADEYRQAVDRQRAAHAQAPGVDRYRDFLSKHYYNLGRALRKLGRADEAARVALERKTLWKDHPQRLLSIAEELALASNLLTGNVPSELTRDGCAELSVAALREARAAGVPLPDDLEKNQSFAALRGRADFNSLVHPEAR